MSNTISITLDADNLAQTRGYDEDGEPIVVSLEEAVIAEAARQLKAHVEKSCEQGIANLVRSIADEEIRAIMRPTLEKVIDGQAFHRTNYYGEKVGSTKTLREHVVEEAMKMLKVANNSTSQSRRESIYGYVDKQITEIVKTELGAELEVAREAVRKQLSGNIAATMAAALNAVTKKDMPNS